MPGCVVWIYASEDPSRLRACAWRREDGEIVVAREEPPGAAFDRELVVFDVPDAEAAIRELIEFEKRFFL